MICNICGHKEATIHLTEIINEQMIEIHLCEECAQEKGTGLKSQFDVSEMIASLTESIGSKPLSEQDSALRCPVCGSSYDDFGKAGRLGCAQCYQTFSKLLLPLIQRVQRSVYHMGKKPSKISRDVRGTHDLRLLQEKMKQCIQSERFEEAAKIRDEIKRFESKSKSAQKEKR